MRRSRRVRPPKPTRPLTSHDPRLRVPGAAQHAMVRCRPGIGQTPMIHHHTIGDAKITGVIEYSGPTHAPEFLYPAVDKAERDAVLKANASWLAPNHHAPNIG